MTTEKKETIKKKFEEAASARKIDFSEAPEVIEVEAPEAPAPETPPTPEKKPEPTPAPEPEKKQGRGRPKGGKNRPRKPKAEKPTIASQSESRNVPSADEIDDIINQHNQQQPPEELSQPAAQIEEKRKGKISGLILLTVIDAIAPILLLKVASMINSKFKKVNVQKIRLTQDEKESLSEIADEVAAMIDTNPVLLLSLSLGGIYSAKITSEI